MRDIYKVDSSKLNEYKTKFQGEKSNFIQGTYKTFSNGYLNSCSDSTIILMKNNINNLLKKIQKGYSSIDTWFGEYIDDVINLDNSLKNGTATVKDGSTNSYISSFSNEIKNEVKEASSIKDSFVNNSSMSVSVPVVGAMNPNEETIKLSIDDENKKEQESLEKLKLEYQTTKDALNIELEDLKKKRDELYSADSEAALEDPDKWLENNGELTWQDYDQMIREKEAEIATVDYYIELTEKSIELLPYYNMEKNDDYEQIISQINIDDIENYSIEDLQNSTETGAIQYNETVDPLLVAEAVKNKFPDKDETNLAYTYTILLMYGKDINYLDVYNYTSEKQRNIYHYIYETQGRTAADEYLKLLYDDITKARAAEEANEFINKLDLNDKNQLEKSLKNIGLVGKQGVVDGVESFNDGLTEAIRNNKDLTIDDYKRAIILQYLQENSNYYDELYQFNSSLGNMIPVVATSALVSVVATPAAGEWVGSALLGTSAYGNAKHMALVNGSDVVSANLYGFLIGVSETTLEKFIGGIPGLSNETGGLFVNMLREGREEFIQEYIDAGFRAAILGEEIDLGDLTSDAANSFIMGALMSGVISGGYIALNVGGQIVNVKMEELMNYMNEHPDVTPSEALAELYPPIPINTNSVDYYTQNYNEMNSAYQEFANYVKLTYEKRGKTCTQQDVNQILQAYESGTYNNISREYRNAAMEAFEKYKNKQKIINDMNAISLATSGADVGVCKGKKVKRLYDANQKPIDIMCYEYVRSDGKIIYLDENFNEHGNIANYNINFQLNQMDLLKSKSPTLYNKIKEVTFLSFENPQDPYWRSMDPNFGGSAYTGGNGKLTVYGIKENTFDDVNAIAHETAHMVDVNHTLSNSIEYQNAVKKDNNYTSDYARRSYEGRPENKYAEDFADFIASATREGPEATKKKYPNRVEFLRKHSPQVYNELFGGK